MVLQKHEMDLIWTPNTDSLAIGGRHADIYMQAGGKVVAVRAYIGLSSIKEMGKEGGKILRRKRRKL